MASSDEDDLEALRLAALATLKQKQEAQEPQGIQVLSSLSVPNTNQYHQDGVGMHPDSYGYEEYGEVPFAFQQAVFKQQQRGRGRGYQRGRGRGRGNRFPNKPVPQSALIVIQVEGSEDQQPKQMEKSRDSRPFLLRPQDKWASTEGSSQESTPTRPKDTSKFRRYDDESDSEEDEDVGKRQRHDSDTRNFPVNMSLEDVSSDTEIELNKSLADDDVEIQVHNDHQNEVEIHNENLNDIEIHNSDEKTEAADEISKTVKALNEKENDNRVFKQVADSDLLFGVKMDTSDVNTPSGALNEVNVSNVNVPLVGESCNNDGDADTRKVLKNKNIELQGDNTFESDSTPLRDEGTPLQDELRQDDSVSNSYTTFSRFNRRNRCDSDTGSEESEEDIDDAILDSSRSHDLDSGKESVDSDDNEVNNEDNVLESDVELEANESLQPTTTAKTHEPSQDSRSSLQSSTASKTSSQLLASSSSSSSESAAESTSSSSESDSEGSSVSSDSKKKSVTKHESVAKGAKSDVRSHKDANPFQHHEKRNSCQEERRVSKNRDNDQIDMISVNHQKSKRKSEELQDTERTKSKRSPMYGNDSKSHRDRYNESQVKADPEFDATNYRDDKMSQKSDKRHDKYDRRPVGDHGSQDNSRSGWKRPSDDRTPVDRSKGEKVESKNRRYFEEIGRLKNEEGKDRVRRQYDTSKMSKSRIDDDRKSFKSSIDDGSNVKQREGARGDSRHGKRSKDYVRQSKSDHHVHDSKSVKSSKSANYIEESAMIRDKQQRKSNDDIRSKKSSSHSEKVKADNKDVKKHKSTNDSWKSESSSDSNSDSERSISSLSDLSSDSETETWRDKKHGAKRKTADIELEKRRRDLKERNKRRLSDRSGNRKTRNGDGPRNRTYNQRDRKHSPESNRSKSRREDLRDRNQYPNNSDIIQNPYKKKYNEFHHDKSAGKKNFEELSSSDSEPGVKKHRGVVSVVKSDRTKASSEIPSLLKISVTKPKSENVSKSKKKSSKAERLIIHVDKSPDDDDDKKFQTKMKKKKKKHKKSWSSNEDSDERPQKQVVNVTFSEESKPDKSQKSVYDRLGIPVHKSKIRSETGSGDAGYLKRSFEERQTSSEKRIKLSESGKYSKYDKTEREDAGGNKDSVLNQRIQKIKEKNAEILRRKQLVEQDKQIYG